MDNVISLDERRKQKSQATVPNTLSFENILSFEEVAKQNEELKAKLEQERKEKNAAVLRQYRIK